MYKIYIPKRSLFTQSQDKLVSSDLRTAQPCSLYALYYAFIAAYAGHAEVAWFSKFVVSNHVSDTFYTEFSLCQICVYTLKHEERLKKAENLIKVYF